MTDNEWEKVRLGELITIKHGYPFKSEFFSEFLPGQSIVINIGNFKYTGGFRFESTTLKGYIGDYPKEFVLTPGDILLVMTCQTSGGEILGISGRIPDDGQTYLHNQRMGKVVITDPARVERDFFYWLFLSPDFNRELFTSASGTKILHTSPKRIEAFCFRLPSLLEQKAIAHILSTLDDKIELNQQMNRNLEAIAQVIFKSWFVDFDPVRAKMEGQQPVGMDAATAALFPDSFEDSPIGEIPKGWTIKPLDQVANFLNGLALQKYPPISNEYLPVIKIAELRRGITELSGRASPNINKEYVAEDGDILFSWSGSLEVCIWCGGKGALNQHLFKVTSTEFPRWFYYQWVKYYLPNFQAIAASKATTMGHIQRHHLSEAQVLVPPVDTLQMMDKRMTALLNQIVSNNLESHTLRTIRDTLLPKLMSGEIRVKEAEKLVEAVA